MTTPPRTAADLLNAIDAFIAANTDKNAICDDCRIPVDDARHCSDCPIPLLHAARVALRAAPSPGAGETLTSRCPTCARALHKVMRPSGSMLNDDQFDAVRAGDWYCDTCPSNERGNTGYRYFWTRELAQPPPVSASPAKCGGGTGMTYE
jgi:hypothetical protein